MLNPLQWRLPEQTEPGVHRAPIRTPATKDLEVLGVMDNHTVNLPGIKLILGVLKCQEEGRQRKYESPLCPPPALPALPLATEEQAGKSHGA